MPGDGKKKKCYSNAFKLKVLYFAKQKGKHQAAKLIDVDKKHVWEWRQMKEKLSAALKSQKRFRGARHLRAPNSISGH